MDLNALELFVAVAETSSFSVSAKKLGVPKSTVSRGLQRLERELGVTLVNRTTRQVSLSTAGQALLERVGPQLAQLKKTLGELPEIEEKPSGHLRITAPVDLGATMLPELVASFVARCPSVSVEVNVSNRVVDLVGEQFDLAFRGGSDRLRDSSLVAKKAGVMAMRLFAAPAYLARRGTPRTLKELDGHDWVVFPSFRELMLTNGTDAVTVHPKGRIVADDLFFIREAAVQGAGIAVVPPYLAEKDVAAGQLARVLPRYETRNGGLWLVTPPGHLPKRTIAFRDYAVDWFKTHPLGTPGT
ncbi:MAG: LysR family transcriptional regulator [Myxococcaceae bacterium]|nr:LysR family transcriptional regulator [Myxococcaceae bacterium]